MASQLVDWARAHEMPAKTINAALERLKKTDLKNESFMKGVAWGILIPPSSSASNFIHESTKDKQTKYN
jgi:hypothetical protein